MIVLLTEDLRYIYLKSFLDYNFTFVWSEFMELFIYFVLGLLSDLISSCALEFLFAGLS